LSGRCRLVVGSDFAAIIFPPSEQFQPPSTPSCFRCNCVNNTTLLRRVLASSLAVPRRMWAAYSCSVDSTHHLLKFCTCHRKIDKRSPYSITEHRVPSKIPSLPVCLYRLVILCQRLRFVLSILALYKFVCMYVRMYVPKLIPVLSSQTAGDVSHEPGGKLPLLSARLAVTLATLKRAATNFAAW